MVTFEELLQTLENIKNSANTLLDLAYENANNHGAAEAWREELDRLEGDVSDAESVLTNAGWRGRQ